MARIGIDVDGVLRDYPRAVVDVFKKYMPVVVKDEVVTGYNFPNIDLPWGKKAKLIFTTWADTIYRYARPMPGATKDFQALKKWARGAGHKLVCVTSNSGDLAVYTREWLDKHGFTFNEYHFLPHEMTSNFKPNKASIPIDFLVDDSPGVYEAWVKAKGDDSHFILIDHPYNREVPARNRASSLNRVSSIILAVSTKFPPNAFDLPPEPPRLAALTSPDELSKVEYDVQKAYERIHKIIFKPIMAYNLYKPPQGESPGAHEDGTILDKAKSLVFGDRGQDYGHPKEDFTRTAGMWTAMTGGKFEFQPEHVALFMVALKISREMNKHKRDNLVDIAGYAQTCETVLEPNEGQDG